MDIGGLDLGDRPFGKDGESSLMGGTSAKAAGVLVAFLALLFVGLVVASYV